MDPKDKHESNPRPGTTGQRAAPGSKPTPKVFIPYLILAAVLVAAFFWLFMGPKGESRDPAQELDRKPDPVPTIQPGQ